jgi:hypothetical protein
MWKAIALDASKLPLYRLSYLQDQLTLGQGNLQIYLGSEVAETHAAELLTNLPIPSQTGRREPEGKPAISQAWNSISQYFHRSEKSGPQNFIRSVGDLSHNKHKWFQVYI